VQLEAVARFGEPAWDEDGVEAENAGVLGKDGADV